MFRYLCGAILATPRHSEDELDRLTTGRRERRELFDVVEREQAAIGHDDQALQMRIAPEHRGEHRHQRGRLRSVAGEHLVVDLPSAVCTTPNMN